VLDLLRLCFCLGEQPAQSHEEQNLEDKRNGDEYYSLLTYQDLSLDVQTHKVKRGDREVNLSPKEFSLLEFLIRHPEQVFSSEAIVDRVWASFSDVSPESVRTYVTRLRSKIDDDGDVSLIQSVYGVGYKLSSEK